MKSVSVALKAHYASEATTLARLWYVQRRDGVVHAYTDHDKAITFETQTDFGDPDVVADVTYQPTSTYDVGAVQTSAALNVDDVSLTGLLALDAITAADVEAGLWDGGNVQVLEVNYRDLTMGANILRFGEIGEVQRSGQQFSAEIRGLMQHLQNTIVRIVTASCDADLGDARCGVDLEALRVAGTVTSVVSPRAFTASAMAQAVDYFQYGVLTWEPGSLNAGLSMEVKAFAVGGIFELQLDMPYAVAPGDEFTVVPGCNKIGRTGDCKGKFDNLNRFRGFEDIPGQDKIMLVGGQ